MPVQNECDSGGDARGIALHCRVQEEWVQSGGLLNNDNDDPKAYRWLEIIRLIYCCKLLCLIALKTFWSN